ncbi:MAG: sulfotransferase [Cellvibrionales bacterium]|nr:sulfotransferase [Cellvibrionales bacterium]
MKMALIRAMRAARKMGDDAADDAAARCHASDESGSYPRRTGIDEPDFASYNFEWFTLIVTALARRLLRAGPDTALRIHENGVETVAVQDRQAGQTEAALGVLKCPQHMEQLPVLQAVFPDATVVTHRDPVAVIQSAMTMLAYG